MATALKTYVIYENPIDLEPGFAVREFLVYPGVTKPGELLGSALLTIYAARALVPPGLVCVGRRAIDQPHVVEVWV